MFIIKFSTGPDKKSIIKALDTMSKELQPGAKRYIRDICKIITFFAENNRAMNCDENKTILYLILTSYASWKDVFLDNVFFNIIKRIICIFKKNPIQKDPYTVHNLMTTQFDVVIYYDFENKQFLVYKM